MVMDRLDDADLVEERFPCILYAHDVCVNWSFMKKMMQKS